MPESLLSHLGTDRQCKARSTTSGEQCRKPAIVGGTVCDSHGGKQQRRRLEREEQERRVKNLLGLERKVDPFTALMEQVWEAAGNVAYLRLMVQELPEGPII